MFNLENLSDGRKHTYITIALSVPSIMIGVGIDGIRGGILMGLGCLSGIIISPDLDQEGLTESETIFLRIPVIGFIFTAIMFSYWLLYAICFKHRGISHWPLVGTLTRVLYIVATILLIQFIWNIEFFSVLWPFVPMWVLGLMISDLGHWARDFTTSGFHL